MSKGIGSYEELARSCNVTRSTIYRRISNLEKARIITRQLHVGIDYERLNLIAVQIGINVAHTDEERIIDALKKYSEIKMMWRTYGPCNLVVVLFCDKGDTGKTIFKMSEMLEKLNAVSFQMCVGFSWEKLDLAPF